MSVQYLSNKDGQITAVQVPIDEWELIKTKYPDIESNMPLPAWQKELIDIRLDAIKSNPGSIKPIKGLLKELDHIDE